MYCVCIALTGTTSATALRAGLDWNDSLLLIESRAAVPPSNVGCIAWLDERGESSVRVMECSPILASAHLLATPWQRQSVVSPRRISTSAARTNRTIDRKT